MEKTSESEALFPLTANEKIAALYERTDMDVPSLAQRMIESYQNIYPVSREYVQKRINNALSEEEMELYRGLYTTNSNLYVRNVEQVGPTLICHAPKGTLISFPSCHNNGRLSIDFYLRVQDLRTPIYRILREISFIRSYGQKTWVSRL
jgi:hypothetical protein